MTNIMIISAILGLGVALYVVVFGIVLALLVLND